MQHKTINQNISLLFVVIVMFFSIFQLYSQEIIWGNSLGLFGGANLNMHSPNMKPSFTFLPYAAELDVKDAINSFTGFAGIEGDFQLSKLFVLTGRIGYDFAGVNFQTKSVNTNYDLKTSLHYLDFTPMVKLVNIIPSLESIYFTTGFNFSVPIIKKYDVTQQVGSTQRNDLGTIPQTQMHFSVPIGIGYIWKYNWELAIIPEVSYNIGLSNVSSNIKWEDWKLNQLKAGVSITYKLPSSNNKKVKVDDTTTPTKINVGMDNVYYVGKNEQIKVVESIRLEEAEYGEYLPLIPYIFYDINETEVPEAYKNKPATKTSAGVPNEEILPDNAPSLAYRLLDIVGKRLVANQNASLTITGTIDSKYETNIQVSAERANKVKNYLVNNFNIDESRLRVESIGLPSKPSAQSVKDGIVENRRVELSSNIPNILDPVFIKGEKVRFSTPDNVHFVPSVESNKPIISWVLEIYQADKIIKQFSGDKIDDDIKWDIMMNDIYPSELPIEYKYSVYTEDDNEESYVGHIRLDYISTSKNKFIEQADYTINKYSLVLFDFDSPLLTEQNKQIIDKLIIPNVKFGSSIDIYGYSDRIGNSEYNRKLSLQRADAVKNYIHTKNKVPIRISGLGNDTEIFDNDSIIGRQLSRTVQILVITPKEK
jgi:outer membrane protein OmpA-like peptidoglycan-associated protein